MSDHPIIISQEHLVELYHQAIRDRITAHERWRDAMQELEYIKTALRSVNFQWKGCALADGIPPRTGRVAESENDAP